MKITKFVHSCLLVEMPAPVNRTALFDPGVMSEEAVDVGALMYLDDIFITHEHSDHLSTKIIKKLIAKFPEVRITAPQGAVNALVNEGIIASTEAPDGITLFNSPHEKVAPLYPVPVGKPDEYGYHYLDMFSHPGDSHSFMETKAILALPISAPWGSLVRSVELALQLQPKHILPVHDWHLSDAAREAQYERLEQLFAEHDITFHKLQTGVPVIIKA